MENPTLSTPRETPLLGLHVSANAEMGEYFGTVLPARFGDFGSEYRAIRRAVALVDTNFRAVFSLSGPDRHRYLNWRLPTPWCATERSRRSTNSSSWMT